MVSFGLVRFGARSHAARAVLKLSYAAEENQRTGITGQVPPCQKSVITSVIIVIVAEQK